MPVFYILRKVRYLKKTKKLRTKNQTKIETVQEDEHQINLFIEF